MSIFCIDLIIKKTWTILFWQTVHSELMNYFSTVSTIEFFKFIYVSCFIYVTYMCKYDFYYADFDFFLDSTVWIWIFIEPLLKRSPFKKSYKVETNSYLSLPTVCVQPPREGGPLWSSCGWPPFWTASTCPSQCTTSTASVSSCYRTSRRAYKEFSPGGTVQRKWKVR